MKYWRTLALTVVLAFEAATAEPPAMQVAPSQGFAGAPLYAEVALPASRRVTFTSAVNGKSYTLFVEVPSFSPPPPAGYPVVYVLDGDQYFGTACGVNFATGGQLAVIVAISYGLIQDPALVRKVLGRKADEAVTVSDMGRANSLLRGDDMYPPVSPANRGPDWMMPERFGGLDKFLKVIETEIKPRVAALAPVDRSHQAIFGHSAGGLAVLRALLTQPSNFNTYIMASPVIWWDGRAVLADLDAFSGAVEAHRISPRVLIAVGELEETKDPHEAQRRFLDSLPPDRRAQAATYVQKLDQWGDIFGNTRDLGMRLQRLRGGPGYKAEFVLFAGEDHSSVAFAALNRAIRFARE